MIASKTENACSSVFLWSESWTSYVESTSTSELNRFLNLVLKQPWEHMTHSMISWGWAYLMWPIPKKCSYLLARNATSVSFEWHLQCITLTSFHWRKTCFSFGQEVAFHSLSVVSHKWNMLIYVSLEWCPVHCTFCNHLSEQCPFSMSFPNSQQLFLCFCQCWEYVQDESSVFHDFPH